MNISISLNIAWVGEYFDPICVPELELQEHTNTASSASYLELCPEKLRERVKYLLESECVFI
jgi:hypothetical protein